jgi:cellulose synthase/poly-beta-1,6-N-acetylglucosamine synthase-like glycosyltransferase
MKYCVQALNSANFASLNIFLYIGAAYLLVQIWQWIQFLRYKAISQNKPSEWPFISVWVAARNEEENIEACLNSLIAMDYPKEKLQIIVGNDQSTDKTKQIASAIAEQNPQLLIIDIVDHPELKAKARVMAQIDKHAQGDFYLVTDADVIVKPSWAKEMIMQLTEETGVASGTTMVQAEGFWGSMQSIDWAYFMGLLNVISYSGIPATAVGNNMIVRKKAYWETGGYGAIRFSITEDYKLYSEVCAKGWKWKNIMNPKVLAYSLPTNGFISLLHQRKRWLSGGKALPWYWWVLFGIFGLYYFIIPALLLSQPLAAIALLIAKFGLQYLHIYRIYSLLGEPQPRLIQHLQYEFYLFILTISTAIFFLIPVKTIWKGRAY